MSERHTHKAAILKHLQSGGVLTHCAALSLFGCARLAARVCELREEGYAIQSAPVQGEPYWRYWMATSAA